MSRCVHLEAWAPLDGTEAIDQLQDELVPARGSFTDRNLAMNAAARQTLAELRSLSNIERYLRTAKAELASSPCDERLHAFIELAEGLLRDEKEKLIAQ